MTGRSRILDELANPNGRFCRDLARFRHRTTVAATHWDIIVPFCTAAICCSNPFPVPNFLTGDLESFWRIDAALGFEEGDCLPLHARGGPAAEELEASILNLAPD